MTSQLVEMKADEKEYTGSEILLRCLVAEGVEVIFGYPGGAVLPIYDSLYDGQVKHLLARHEQGAIHAADGYARATGKPGVVIATSGPGATNLVTGIATAMMDSVPLVCITGNVAQHLLGTDAFQEADITGITMPITKHNYLVRDVRELPRIVKEAFTIATGGRPGPVLIDIPKDVSNARASFHYPESVYIRGFQPTTDPHPLQVQKLYDAIAQAKRPVILAGGGVVTSGAAEQLSRFAEQAQIPVTTTLMGIGGFSGTHPLWMGMPGMHGTYAANHALLNCDLLIGIGARFDDRVTMGRIDKFATKAKIAHIDIDPAEIGKNVETFIPIVGDVKKVLEVVNEKVPKSQSDDWVKQIDEWKQTYPLVYKISEESLKPQWVIQHLYHSTNGEAIVTTDVGQHQMWVAQYYRFAYSRSLLSSGGLGTMGFGFPAAIGAQLGVPDRTVIAVTGDGGFQMTAQELAVVALENIPVKVAIINNQCLGMVRQWQEVFYKERYCDVDLSGGPDFVKLADAYGVKAWRARTQEEAIQVWQEALRHPGPAVVDFWVTPQENVYPMVAPGAGLDEMLMGDEEA
ncbi:biosynthetic-type acetolactate synthase large subunit [Paenactinomyces guangxiensis]|uniref:Acetolactate synthase n=1 Tax=Paenactinomyces guangxiensis TaxID=1490290 RepID=A0A7W1WR47_9BACL|nr:biosynthetic-type acetolactate synthase large subunit [Paenactinomyces guangxiensis]MBA4494526.1 biosynthetic-type acetolactate synthase large subunit [Paenactinomyces guangxiensis]MBH8591712.1 biosynthetic-type acetolactate synthase large subunit [Paenactinomyces guangxiensis]